MCHAFNLGTTGSAKHVSHSFSVYSDNTILPGPLSHYPTDQGGPNWTLHSPLWSSLFTPAYIQSAKNRQMELRSPSVWRIGWQSGVNGRVVRLHPTAHSGEDAVSALHKWSGQGPVIRLLSGDKRTDSPLSWQSRPHVKRA